MSQANESIAVGGRTGEELPTSLSTCSLTEGSTPFDRDAEFWLDDGSVILVARQVGFRVYRGLLASQSRVFRDVFSSSSSSASETYQGCPLVHVSDSPQDLRHLLRVLIPVYNRNFFLANQTKVFMTFDHLSAVIRLSHKYDIEDVLSQGCLALRTCFSSTFDSFGTVSVTLPGVPGASPYSTVHPIPSVNLARLTGTPDILPYAVYKCFLLDGKLLDGWTREDGTVEHLNNQDLRRCLDARSAIVNEIKKSMFTVFGPSSRACGTNRAKSCEKEISATLMAVLSKEGLGDVHSDILSSWRQSQIAKSAACNACRVRMLDLDTQYRKECWGRLPDIFSLKDDLNKNSSAQPERSSSSSEDESRLVSCSQLTS
ncbi:hypothetical protein C8Q78DRAFT_978671 [Trametes maxima]|nr:hypothetical protein C8Q78DRAFT_978671 [Trametes maxima]